MTWAWILGACALAYVTKLAGFLVPQAWLERPVVGRIATATTVALLAALIVTNALGSGTRITWDARLVAVLVGGLLAWRKAPFLLIVVAAATATALARLLGCP